MDDSEVEKYKKLLLISSEKLISQIKEVINTNTDLLLLHRLFHNLKGQILFMDLTEIGGICFKGEKLMEDVIKNKSTIDDPLKETLIFLLEKIERGLKKYENINRR